MPVFPLITKVKEAFRGYLEAAQLPELSAGGALGPLGCGYHRGVRTKQTLPAVCVHTAALEPALDCDDSPPKNAAVMITLESLVTYDPNGSSAGSEDNHDLATTALLAALTPYAVCSFANSENVTNRPIELADGAGFHLSVFREPAVVKHFDPQRGTFVTVLTIAKVMVMDANGDTAL